MKIYSFWIFLFFSVQSFAHEPKPGSIHVALGPFVQGTQVQRSMDPANSPVFFGLGILGQADTNRHGGLEVGAAYFRKTYQRAFGNTHIVERIDKLSVPIGYRHWFFANLSLSLAFTACFSIGDYQTIFSDTVFGNATSARDPSEVGGDISIQWEFWRQDRVSIFFDTRYYYSFSAKSNEDANLFSALFGIKYLIQD